jgi:hypothetical protein
MPISVRKKIKYQEITFTVGVKWPGCINPLNAELNPIRHLLALAGAHHFVHVSKIRVKCHAMSMLEKVNVKVF